MRLLLWCLLTVLPAAAQFENLSTTGDGGVIYFSTRLRPQGTNAKPWPALYRLDTQGFHLVKQALTAPSASREEGGWLVDSASISTDGSVIAINSRTVCTFSSICLNVPQEFCELQPLSLKILGLCQVSANARYVTIWRETGFGQLPSPDALKERGLNRLDLRTAERTPVGAAPARTGRWTAADGTVLIQGWQLVTPAGGAILFGAQPVNPYRADLSPDTSFVLYQETEAPSPLLLRDRSGAETTLTNAGSSPSISGDSQTVLYLSPVNGVRQAFLWSRNGAARQVTFEPAGITEAVLSGRTNLIVAVTGIGQLITIDARNGYRSEFIGPSPLPPPFPRSPLFNEALVTYPAVAAGSSYSAAAPGATGVNVNGNDAFIISRSPTQITYQVDWDTPLQDSVAELVFRASASGFEAPIAIRSVDSFAPEFLPLGSEPETRRPLVAIHDNWRGLVTTADPATPSEILHLYAIGLGPVSPPVATGVPGPAMPPATVPFSCRWQLDNAVEIDATVLFAGLAPGLIGYYQVSVLAPQTSGIVSLSCGEDRARAALTVR